MDSLVLTVMDKWGIRVDLSPLAWLTEFVVVARLAAGKLNWLIVGWQHLLGFSEALVRPKACGYIGWSGTFSTSEKIFDDGSIL